MGVLTTAIRDVVFFFVLRRWVIDMGEVKVSSASVVLAVRVPVGAVALAC
jgi:hypothetical protein